MATSVVAVTAKGANVYALGAPKGQWAEADGSKGESGGKGDGDCADIGFYKHNSNCVAGVSNGGGTGALPSSTAISTPVPMPAGAPRWRCGCRCMPRGPM